MDEAVCVIGAGSSGIVAVKVLREHGIPVVCFESGSGIGGNWRYLNDNGMSASYKSLHINTSKSRMAYADYPMPESYPDYPHHSEILRYFESYVDHFGFRDSIRFRTTVTQIQPAEGGGWAVTAEDEEGFQTTTRFRAVLVSSGHHWDPKMPSFPGEFNGRARHSHDYKIPEGLADQRVLVVGIGNSGVDIACESSRVAAKTFLSTRRSAHILPKYAFGKPIDTLTNRASSRLPMGLQKLAYTAILNLTRGPQAGFGVPEPEHHILQAHPTISADLLNLVGHGRVLMKPDVERLCGDTVRFVDGSEEAIDEIVYATGYKVTFPFLPKEVLDPAENRVCLYRHVVHLERPDLYFIGLVQPLGAIMPLAEAQSHWVAKVLTAECSLPAEEVMVREEEKDWRTMQRRYVTSTRHTIQVDFYPYLRVIEGEIRAGKRRARGSRVSVSAGAAAPEAAST